MAPVIKLAIDTVQYHHHATRKFIIQSDNLSGFGSQEIVLFILNLNTRLDYKNDVSIRWLFTEAQTGKT